MKEDKDKQMIIWNCKECNKKINYDKNDILSYNQFKEYIKLIPLQNTNKNVKKSLENEILSIHKNCENYDTEHPIIIEKEPRMDFLNGVFTKEIQMYIV
jgi:hypothetical protein